MVTCDLSCQLSCSKFLIIAKPLCCVRRVWLQLQLLSLVLFAEYCWFNSFLSFEFYPVKMLVFLCLRISASSIWNFSRFGVFYWYFVQFSAWSSVNHIAVFHATPFLSSTTHAVVQHWTGKPVTSSAAYNCVGVAVVLGNTVDARDCSQYSDVISLLCCGNHHNTR